MRTINIVRSGIDDAENRRGTSRESLLLQLSDELQKHAEASSNGDKVLKLASVLEELAETS
jgi:hypothetical protein